MKAIWADTFVEEGNLTKYISTLRKVLGDTGAEHQYIETVPKRGFRFVAGVREVPAGDSELVVEPHTRAHVVEEGAATEAEGELKQAAGRQQPTTGDGKQRRLNRSPNLLVACVVAAGIVGAVCYLWLSRNHKEAETYQAEVKSLAVLPFKSLNRDANDDYLGVGIADTITTKVSQLGELIVRPTSAVQKYAGGERDSLGAAKQLNVDAVLDGTVQRAGDRLRVSANLLRTRDGASLWADSFDVRSTDIFAIEDEVSKEVAARLRVKLSSAQVAQLTKRHTSSPEAYEYYVKGVQIFHQSTQGRFGDKLEAAIEQFKKAVEIDPKYALAHAQLAYCYALIAVYQETDHPVWLGLTRQEIRQAEMLDPKLAEVHLARYEIFFSVYEGFQIEEGVRELRLAQQLDPGVGHIQMAHLYAHLGLEEPALRELQRAMEIDPTSEVNQGRFISIHELLGKHDEAISASRRFFPDRPDKGPAYSYLWKNQWDEAQRILESSLGRHPGNVNVRSSWALFLAAKGKFQEAEAEIPAIIESAKPGRGYHHVAHDIAAICALQGKSQQAIEWLKKAAETGLPNYPLFARDPHLDRIRREPAFVRFMADLKSRWEGYRRKFE